MTEVMRISMFRLDNEEDKLIYENAFQYGSFDVDSEKGSYKYLL